MFDIVAVHVQEVAPDLGEVSTKTKALHLRMLRSAIERGPEELQMILKEVLDLPAKQQELATLLQETTLSAIITAAKTVADRLKFVAALENIVFDPETKGRIKNARSSIASSPKIPGYLARSIISGSAIKTSSAFSSGTSNISTRRFRSTILSKSSGRSAGSLT